VFAYADRLKNLIPILSLGEENYIFVSLEAHVRVVLQSTINIGSTKLRES
jgi:hypothetical protein